MVAAVDSREKRLDFGRREVRIWRDLVVGLEKDRAERRYVGRCPSCFLR